MSCLLKDRRDGSACKDTAALKEDLSSVPVPISGSLELTVNQAQRHFCAYGIHKLTLAHIYIAYILLCIYINIYVICVHVLEICLFQRHHKK